MSQIHGWQSQCRGLQNVIKTRYHKDPVFKAAVDYLMASKLDHKDIRRVAAIASTVKEMNYSWWLEKK
jgi:hypothetical protein